MVIINGALPGRLSEFNSYGNGRYIYISSPKLDEIGQNMTITENSLAHTFWECKYHVVFMRSTSADGRSRYFLNHRQYECVDISLDINNTSVKNVIIAPQELKQPLQPGVLLTKYKNA